MCALLRFLLEWFSHKCRIVPLKHALGHDFENYFRVVEQQTDEQQTDEQQTDLHLCSYGELAIYTTLITNPNESNRIKNFFHPNCREGFCRAYFYPLVSDFALNRAREFKLYVDIDVTAFC